MNDFGIWIGIGAFLVSAATIIGNAIMHRSKVSHKAMEQTIALLKEQLNNLERDLNAAKDRIQASEIKHAECEARCKSLESYITQLTARLFSTMPHPSPT